MLKKNTLILSTTKNTLITMWVLYENCQSNNQNQQRINFETSIKVALVTRSLSNSKYEDLSLILIISILKKNEKSTWCKKVINFGVPMSRRE